MKWIALFVIGTTNEFYARAPRPASDTSDGAARPGLPTFSKLPTKPLTPCGKTTGVDSDKEPQPERGLVTERLRVLASGDVEA